MNAASHDALHAHADAIGAAAARVVRLAWADLWHGLKDGPASYQHNYRHALLTLHQLPTMVYATLRTLLGRLLGWAHDRAASELMRTVPRHYLRRAAARRLRTREGRAARRLREAGALQFAIGLGLDVLDLAAPLRHDLDFPFGAGATPGSMIPEEERNLFRSLLFPPLDREQVQGFLDRIMPPVDWLARIGQGSQERTPQTLANLIAGQVASGISTRQVATGLLPFFDGSRVRATRAARTFGAYIGTSANLDTSEQLGDLIAGYRVIDPGGPTARKDHMKRSGTTYWKSPKSGQYSVDVMPQPPYDRGGPNEDEEGLRWNCRCFLLPLIADIE